MTRFVRQLYESLLSYETRLRLYKLRHAADFEKKRSVINPSDKGDFSLRPFDIHHCIFIHITKTAGTSVAKGLFDYLPYHYTAIDYRVIYGRDTFERYYKFAFVRNPWDRLYSAYRYLKSGGWNAEDRMWSQQHLSGYDDFNDFVLRWLSEENIASHIHFRPQYQFVCDDSGKLLLDYLAYFETIAEDFEKIAGHLQLERHLKHHNASPVGRYQDIYDDDARSRVAEVYARDIELFGYDFDGIAKRRVVHPGN